MIIGFCGHMRAGKDTAGAYLIKEYGFERRAFADPLKKSVAVLFNIPFWEIDKHKLDKTVYVAIGYKNEPEIRQALDQLPEGSEEILDRAGIPQNMWSPISEYSFREFLKRYGTESHRDVFNEDFWVDQALPVGGYYAGRKIVLTDVRFQNEVDRINALGGTVCKITKPGPVNQDPHSSEWVDNLVLGMNGYNISNDGTIDHFYKQIDKMLDLIGDRGVGI